MTGLAGCLFFVCVCLCWARKHSQTSITQTTFRLRFEGSARQQTKMRTHEQRGMWQDVPKTTTVNARTPNHTLLFCGQPPISERGRRSTAQYRAYINTEQTKKTVAATITTTMHPPIVTNHETASNSSSGSSSNNTNIRSCIPSSTSSAYHQFFLDERRRLLEEPLPAHKSLCPCGRYVVS